MKYFSGLLLALFVSTALHAQQRAASVNYARAVAQARVIIDKHKQLGEHPPMPEPPSYDPPCDADQRKSKWQQFMKEVDQYHKTSFGDVGRIFAIINPALDALVASGGTPVPEMQEIVLEVVKAVCVPKVNTLLKQYGPSKSRRGSDEKFFAVQHIVLMIHKELTVAFASGGGLEGKWIDALMTWMGDYLASNLEKIRQDHDYTRVQDVLEADKGLSTMMAGDVNMDKIISELQDALTFKLKLAATYEMQAGSGGGKVTTEAEIELTPNLYGQTEWEGKGHGKYTFGEFRTDEAPLAIALDSFRIVAQMKNFDACKTMVVDVSFDRVAAMEDQMVYQGRSVASKAIIEPMAKGIFVISGNYQPSTGYTFPGLTLHNKQQLAVDETINKSQAADGGTVRAQIHIQLVHSPKKSGMKTRKLQTSN